MSRFTLVEVCRAPTAGSPVDTHVLGITDDGVRSVFSKIVDNYKRKLAAATGLVNAAEAADVHAVKAAATELSAAAEEGRRLALGLIDQLRPFVNPDDLSRLLTEKGAELASNLGQD
jgi:hypothetical protein